MYLADRYELIIMDTDSFALSFYRFQNVLGRSKYSFAIIATPKNFVLALKLNLLNSNHLLVCTKSLGRAQYLKKYWTSTNYCGTCRRTRRNASSISNTYENWKFFLKLTQNILYLMNKMPIYWSQIPSQLISTVLKNIY